MISAPQTAMANACATFSLLYIFTNRFALLPSVFSLYILASIYFSCFVSFRCSSPFFFLFTPLPPFTPLQRGPCAQPPQSRAGLHCTNQIPQERIRAVCRVYYVCVCVCLTLDGCSQTPGLLFQRLLIVMAVAVGLYVCAYKRGIPVPLLFYVDGRLRVYESTRQAFMYIGQSRENQKQQRQSSCLSSMERRRANTSGGKQISVSAQYVLLSVTAMEHSASISIISLRLLLLLLLLLLFTSPCSSFSLSISYILSLVFSFFFLYISSFFDFLYSLPSTLHSQSLFAIAILASVYLLSIIIVLPGIIFSSFAVRPFVIGRRCVKSSYSFSIHFFLYLCVRYVELDYYIRTSNHTVKAYRFSFPFLLRLCQDTSTHCFCIYSYSFPLQLIKETLSL